MPSSEREQRATRAEKAAVEEHAGPVTETLTDAAHEMQDQLREPVRDAAKSIGVQGPDVTGRLALGAAELR